MKATLKFNLPEETHEHQDALHGSEWKRALAEVAGWILSWGADAEVLRPPELRRRLAATAATLAGRYSADSA